MKDVKNGADAIVAPTVAANLEDSYNLNMIYFNEYYS
jgi:hypothetical protein